MMTAPAPSSESAAVVALHELELRAGEQPLVAALSWSSGADRRILLRGPSGCGKTTLLHLIAGLDRPRHGRIQVLGRELTRMSARERERFRARLLGLVFQDFHLLRSVSVLDNLRLAAWLAGLRDRRQAALEALEALEVADLAGRNPRLLSQGEKQRVAIARALVHQPALIIADEPTSSLDDGNCERVLGLLEHHAERLDAALLVASHDGRIRPAFDTVMDLPSLSGGPQ